MFKKTCQVYKWETNVAFSWGDDKIKREAATPRGVKKGERVLDKRDRSEGAEGGIWGYLFTYTRGNFGEEEGMGWRTRYRILRCSWVITYLRNLQNFIRSSLDSVSTCLDKKVYQTNVCPDPR